MRGNWQDVGRMVESGTKYVNLHRRPTTQVIVLIIRIVVVEVDLTIVRIPVTVGHSRAFDQICPDDFMVATIKSALVCFLIPFCGNKSGSNVRVYILFNILRTQTSS
jgi:hypothetical protein